MVYYNTILALNTEKSKSNLKKDEKWAAGNAAARNLNIFDGDFTEAYVSVQVNDTCGIGIGVTADVYRAESGAGPVLDLKFPGDKEAQFTKGAVGFNTAILGNSFAAPEIHR